MTDTFKVRSKVTKIKSLHSSDECKKVNGLLFNKMHIKRSDR